MLAPTALGCGERTVVANGHILVEGEPASGGRLSLSPTGDGPRAHSIVGDDGSFVLQTSQGTAGAFPGDYRVTFQHQLDQRARKLVANRVRGELDVDEINVIYRSARDKPFAIPDAGSDELILDIRQDLGWERFFSE